MFSCGSSVDIVPRIKAPYPNFSYVFFAIPSSYRGSGFLLSSEAVRWSSLSSTPDHLFVAAGRLSHLQTFWELVNPSWEAPPLQEDRNASLNTFSHRTFTAVSLFLAFTITPC